jgi:hypothetical protein
MPVDDTNVERREIYCLLTNKTKQNKTKQNKTKQNQPTKKTFFYERKRT